MGGVPELINDGHISIRGQQQPIPFIYLYNRGTVSTFASVLDFDTGANIDLLQETGGQLSIGAGFDHGAILDCYALIRQGSTVFGQGYIREARVEGQIQGRITFEELEFGPTAVSRFSLGATPDRLTVTTTNPVALAGQLELLPGAGFDPGPEAVFPIVVSAGEVTGEFAGRPFGQRVQIPGTGQSLLLTRSADSHRVELRRYLPPAVSLSVAPLSFRMAESAGGLGGCFVAPDPAVLLPEATLAGASLTVEITDGYNASVDLLTFRPNPAFPEADEITFEGPAGGEQTVRFRGTNFGTVQLTGGLMTCVLDPPADREAVVALLGRLYYGNTECTANWFTNATRQYPPRTIVVTLTDMLGANEISRIVNFPVLWGIQLPASLQLSNGVDAVLHLQGRFSTDQILPVPTLATQWSESCTNPSVFIHPVAQQGEQTVVGKAAPYCCMVSAQAGLFSATTSLQDSETEIIPFEQLNPIALLILIIFVDLPTAGFDEPEGYKSIIVDLVEQGDCPLLAGMFLTDLRAECYTTPSFHAAGSGQTSVQSLTPFHTLENLMKGTAAGQRWASLYREHGAEVVRLFFQQPSLLTRAQELVATFQPGVVALLAGRGDTVPIYVPMITRVNDFWNALAEHATPALKTVLQQEQARFDNFRMFQNRTFNEWAGLLGIHVPFQPYLHISLMRREATKFHVALNDVAELELSLWRSVDLQTWTQVTNAEIQRDGTTLIFTDPSPPAGQAFYNVRP